MTIATHFFSDFFNTDCLVVNGDPWFSITGATKTLYGHTGGSSLSALRLQLAKNAGHQKPVAGSDFSDFPGILPVTIEADGTKTGRVREALAMSQDTFVALLKLYRDKPTKAGRYAEEITDKLVGISLDLILRKEAGLLHEEAVKAVDESIIRSNPDTSKAFSDSALEQLLLTAWRSYNRDDSLTEVPKKHPSLFGREVAYVLRHGIYARVQKGVLERIDNKRAESGGTMYQYLSNDVRRALVPVVQLTSCLIKRYGLHNIDLVLRDIDEFYPRYSQGSKDTNRVKKMLAL